MRSHLTHILCLLSLLLYLTGCAVENNGPQANAGSDQTVTAGQTLQLNGLLSSASNGVIRHYQWRQISGEPVQFNDRTLAIPRFTAPPVQSQQELSFELEIIDEHSVRDTDEVTIIVVPKKIIPEQTENTLLVEGEGSYQIDDSIELKVFWRGDESGSATEFLWKQIRGKSVDFTVVDSTLSLTMVAPFVDRREILVFQVSAQATSGDQQIATAEVVVMPTEYPKFEISGTVKTTSGQPLAGVEVRVIEDGLSNDRPVLTKSNGAFLFQLEKGFDYVLAFTKPEYVEQVIPVEQQSIDGVNIVNSVMIKPAKKVIFNQASRVDFVGNTGAGVAFDKAQFVDDQGGFLSGNLELSVTTAEVVPSSGTQAYFGLFAGFMKDSVDSVIVSNLGMAKFSFSHQGEPVDLAFAEIVEVLVPLHSDRFEDGTSIQIGDDVPLWTFNVSRGSWEQEGDGTVEESTASPTGLVIRSELTRLSW